MRVLLPLKKAPASSTNSSSESSDLHFAEDDSASSNSILSDQFPQAEEPTTTSTATTKVTTTASAAALIPSNVEFPRSVAVQQPPSAEHGVAALQEESSSKNVSDSSPPSSAFSSSSQPLSPPLTAKPGQAKNVCSDNNGRDTLLSLSCANFATAEASTPSSSSLARGSGVASVSGVGTAAVRARKRRATFVDSPADNQLASLKKGNNCTGSSNNKCDISNSSANIDCDVNSSSSNEKISNCRGEAKDTNSSSSISNSSKKPRTKPPPPGEVEIESNNSSLASKKPAATASGGGSLKPKSKPATTTNLNGGGIMAGGRRKITDRRSNNNRQSYYVDNRDAPNENDPASARGDCPSMIGGDHHHRNQLPNNNHHFDDFVRALKQRGLEIVEQDGDGNCLFRSVSLQVYGDANMHGEVRKRCLDFMARDEEHFSQFITDEPFQDYVSRKRQDGVHGNNPEIQAISELFNRPVEVFVPENGASPLNIFHSQYKTDDVPIRLSYHDGNHYNAVIDPLVPTAGLGLGLPGLKPGLADKLQMAKAVAESDILADQMEYKRALEESQNDELQRAIKESSLSVDNMFKNKAIALSDLDATNFELEQAMLESSLESFRNQEHGRKQSSSTAQRRRPWQQSGSGVASIPRSGNSSEGCGSYVQPAAAAAPSSSAVTYASPNNSFSASTLAASNSSSTSDSSISAVARVNNSDDQQRSDVSYLRSEGVAIDEYPDTVNELVMNGFELHKVIHAYELIGDNFDSLLAFLMSNTK